MEARVLQQDTDDIIRMHTEAAEDPETHCALVRSTEACIQKWSYGLVVDGLVDVSTAASDA
jgi:hypothetical protein